ncbi:hypothetical protein DKG77_01425 [Flagellimonas aquimarina]|jgi:hypothetical protein|uniref:Fibronectin type-III domain-containing protein n=1 Tax=Flagellimonas aquimarina TaxID=2201895 RepID=A0A316KZ81_9FLAO|nr:hypothetical protein [Allomuricauda koreensis]PWL39522.1 hypothetical protein DKG77_01425 [Allomuricauda koreensis]
MKHFFLSILILILLSSCGGNDDPPPAPVGANLVFPLESSECTTGVSINDTQSQVTFEWLASANTDSYTLSAVNLETNMPQTISTAATSASLPIGKGTPYSWSVTSRNSSSDQIATSETWLFYNSGSQTTYAPFPAQLVSPLSGSTVQKSIANEIALSWSGADVDSDISGFEIFFSDQNPPTSSVGNTTSTITELVVSVESNTIYYWKVITTDLEGNTSDSGVFEFKIL